MTKSKQVITTDQFKAIHEVIYSSMIALDIEPTARDARCMFNYIASYLLMEHHQIMSIPENGNACFSLIAKGSTCCFDYPKSYHSWVEVDDIFIDFTSPFYDKFVLKAPGETIPSKMFQKPASSMSTAIYNLINVGDFHFAVLDHLTMLTTNNLITYPEYQHLFKACRQWYNSNPANIPNNFVLNICKCRQITINKINVNINGAW